MSKSEPIGKPFAALAEFAAQQSFDQLPAAVVETTKRVILDALGCALAATTLGDGCRETMAVMSRLGGPPQSTILGLGTKVSSTNAAFANGALVHALNYDPIGAEIGHVGVVGLVAPLAMAEAIGDVTGKELIAASAVACEVTARITLAVVRAGRRPSEKFLSGQLLNYFGAAAGAGRVLGLSAAQMRSALGLALMQMAGSRQIVLSGDPPAKAIYGAFPNQAGVLAALLSKEGLGADCDVVGEPAGLYPMIYNGDYDASVLTEGLGTRFFFEDVEFKPWPTSNNLHPFIEAAGEISRRGIDCGKIRAVEILAHSQLRPWCEPLDIRRRPDNPAAAANSIPFCVAKALVHGDVTLADFTPRGLRDAATLELAARTAHRLDDAVKGAVVNVNLSDGQRLEARVETALGHRSRPVPTEQLREKFRDCCRHTIQPLSRDRVDELIALIESLEQLEDMGRLSMLASGTGLTAPGSIH
ncbi:MAG: MmgE/PrpD family protein [Deltaproteobacteria bacterium]|nr:MmgE/PrpD family protein [Deltaproteobacteria bacterium]